MSIGSERRSHILMIFTESHTAVGVPMLGSCVLSQDGRQEVLTAGDFAIVDTSHPCELIFEGVDRVLVTAVPQELGRIRTPDSSRTAGNLSSTLARNGGRSRINGGRQIEDGESAPPTQLPDTAPDLCGASRAELMNELSSGQLDRPHRMLLERICRYIDQNLGDPHLDAHAIAVAHHISLRYLQKLFQAHGTTVNSWIRGRRLDRSRRDLVDPRHSNRTIGAVGARWSLTPASYFSRIFRQTYGCTPSEVRAAHRRAA